MKRENQHWQYLLDLGSAMTSDEEASGMFYVHLVNVDELGLSISYSPGSFSSLELRLSGIGLGMTGRFFWQEQKEVHILEGIEVLLFCFYEPSVALIRGITNIRTLPFILGIPLPLKLT